MSKRLWVLIAGLTASALSALACTGASESTGPNSREIYSDILARVTKNLHLNHPLAVHPLLGQLNWAPGGPSATMDAFNLSDTLMIRSFVDAYGSKYRLCTLTRQFTCDSSIDDVFVILSGLEETDVNRLAGLAMVVDNRSPPGTRAYFAVEIQPRRGGWKVVSFRRTR